MNESMLKFLSGGVLLCLILFDKAVLANYEVIWNSYFEKPCCGKHHMRHHKGLFTL